MARPSRRAATPQRIVTFEEFMRTPRTENEVASYHGCLAALQRMGLVDDSLNVVERPREK